MCQRIVYIYWSSICQPILNFHSYLLLFMQFAPYGDEGCIMQHLAAAAMGRAHHMGRREHIRFRPSTTAQGHPHFVVVSGAPAGASSSPASSSPVVSPPQSTNGEASLGAVFSFPHYSAPNRDGSSANSPTIRYAWTCRYAIVAEWLPVFCICDTLVDQWLLTCIHQSCSLSYKG